MPTPILLALLIASFFLPQVAALGVIALIRSEVAAIIAGMFTFIVMGAAHVALAFYSYMIMPSWWNADDSGLPFLYILAVLFTVGCIFGGMDLIADKE